MSELTRIGVDTSKAVFTLQALTRRTGRSCASTCAVHR